MTDDTKLLPTFRDESFLQQNKILSAALAAAYTELRQITHDRKGVFQIFRENFGQAGLAGGIALFENEKNEYLIFQSMTTTDKFIVALEQRFNYVSEGIRFAVRDVDAYQQVVQSRRAIYIANTSRTLSQIIPPQFRSHSKSILQGANTSAGIYAPLISENELIGVMCVTHDEITEDDVPLVMAFADQIALALGNARLHQTQRQTHSALAISRDAWHRLIQQTPIGIQVFDPSGYCTEINKSLMEILGVDREDVVGKFNIFRDPMAKAIGTADAARQALHGETVELRSIGISSANRQRTTTGTLKQRIINITIFPVHDDRGAIVNLVSLNVDVTARTESDLLQNALYKIAALATSEGGLQELYHDIHMIVYELMAADNFLIAIHDDKKSLIHLPYFVDEEDEYVESYPFGNGLIEHVIQTGEALLIDETEHRRLMKMGTTALVGTMGPIWLGAPLRAKGRTFGVIAVQHYEDESAYTSYHKRILVFVSNQIAAAIDRKRSEKEIHDLASQLEKQAEMLESMLVTTRTHFYIYNQRGHITYVSPSALKTFGIKADDLLGKSWKHLPFPVSKELALWMQHVFVTSAFATQELWLAVEGEDRCYEVQVNPIREKNGGIEHVVMNMLDITDKKITQETLLHTQKIESLGVLAGGVAHDFNNLLVALMGQSSLALEKLSPDSDSRVHIEKAILAAKQAAELTQQLLAYSGKGSFTMGAVNFNHLIHESSHLIDVATPKSVQLLLNLEERLPDIDADMGQMQQIVMNLILNAAEAIPHHGKIRIETGTQQVAENDEGISQFVEEPLIAGTYVYLQIEDDGDGMDEETMACIFDPFFTTKFTGRGLGLAAVLGIVRGHMGGILVSSRVGEGAVFRLLFPMRKTAVFPPQPIVETAVSAIDSKTDSKTAVLVIDDEPHVREAINDILEIEEITVIAAADGQEGIQLYREHEDEIGLILLDLSMPGLSGYETFIQLREINTAVNIILSSGYSRDEVHQQFAGKHIADFLSKPYDIEALIKKVQRHLGE